MVNTDPEFEFDCPRFSYDLNATDGRSDVDSDYIDSWFLTYHPEHDWKGPSQLDSEKSNQATSSSSCAAKSASSNLGPARPAKRMSTTSSSTSSAQSTLLSKRRGSKGDELKAEDSKHPVREKAPLVSIGSKRKSVSKDSLEDTGSAHSATATDMRDKLDEFRQRKKKETTAENSAALPVAKTSIPLSDYSRSKILSTEAVAVNSTAAQLARAKQLTSRVNKTSTGLQSNLSAASSSSSSLSASSATRLSTRTSTAPPSSARVAPKSASSSRPGAKVDAKSAASSAAAEEASMMELLKKHNKKFAPVPIYEPSRHSVRDVRKWEKSTGKTWSNLKPEDREIANAEIKSIKDLEFKEYQK